MSERHLKVSFASESHSNRTSNPEEEATSDLIIGGVIPTTKSLTLSIPENLDIERILENNSPDFKPFKRYKLVYILDLIYSIPSRKKDMIENYTGYTPISKKILGGVIKNYREYINYLKNNNIVEEDNYIVDKKCSGLRYKNEYSTVTKNVIITDKCLIKNILYLRKNYNYQLTQELEYLQKWFNDDLKVDIEGATNHLMQKYQEDLNNPDILYPILRLNSRLYPIERLHRKETILFFADKTAGRLHTFLTQLKSELREFMTYERKTLCAIDITNSQPYLLQSLLEYKTYTQCGMEGRLSEVNPVMEPNSSILIMLGEFIKSVSPKEDVLRFKEIVSSGRFYEEFGKILIENGIVEDIFDSDELRKIVKEITFATLFCKNSAERYSPSVRIFKTIFPNVYEVMKFSKQEHHPTLAVILQNLEADLVLHKVCKIILEENPDVPIFTLHDSIITTEDNVEFVESILNRVLTENIGVAPSLKIERWE